MKEILLKHNYQWHSAEFDTGITREILSDIIAALESRHIIAISGARRSGKSYIFRQIIASLIEENTPPASIVQINFEDPFFISQKNDAELLEKLYHEFITLKNPKGKHYLFLDEIQNISNWQYWLRDIYDRNSNIKIFITGSNSELMSNELATHLTGRTIAYENFPFSFKEYFSSLQQEQIPQVSSDSTSKEIYERLFPVKDTINHYIEKSFLFGMYPEIISIENEDLIKEILSQYFQNVIFSNIIPRFSIRNTSVIEQLAYYLSTNFTSLYSYRKLADIVGSNENTIKEYIAYFEKAYLFFQIEYFDYSLKKQFKRNHKIYSIDNGLRQATSFSFSPDTGRYAENAVFIHLRRKYSAIYYWQEEHSDREIDFIIHKKNTTIAINVSHTDEIDAREFQAFSSFNQLTNCSRCIIISKNIFKTEIIDDIPIEIIPLWVFVFMDLD